MGDLKGHALPGSLFLLYGLWWAFCSIRRFFLCRRAGSKYVSTVTFSCPCPCGPLAKLPVEGIVKVGLTTFGMLAEIIFNLPVPSMGIIQHATMYFFFLVSGIVDIVMHYGAPLPPGTDYVAVALAFAVEGLLFYYHLHGREIVDIQIHLLLVYVVALTVVVILIEARFQRSALLPLCRSYLLMLQGSWFWAVGIILYGHDKNSLAWDLQNHMDVMRATIYFSWHCAFHFIVLLVLVVVMGRCYHHQTGQNGTDLHLTVLENGDKQEGYRMLTAADDGDGSDIEYEKPVEKAQIK
ncbi:transmembrane protein 45B-like [Physella acuta]|uniref:transmembrane protein 45B-like n=1 Tax=Physella acuta TaxID=109671 RepID=UPI0027DE8D8E|nr:transmembrane protein 45B-like [Physella acuta]